MVALTAYDSLLIAKKTILNGNKILKAKVATKHYNYPDNRVSTGSEMLKFLPVLNSVTVRNIVS